MYKLQLNNIFKMIFSKNNFRKWFTKKTLLKIVLGNLLGAIIRCLFIYVDKGLYIQDPSLYFISLTFIIATRVYLYIVIDNIDFSFSFTEFTLKKIKKVIYRTMRLNVKPDVDTVTDLYEKSGGELYKLSESSKTLFSFNNKMIKMPENIYPYHTMNDEDKMNWINVSIALKAREAGHKYISRQIDEFIKLLEIDKDYNLNISTVGQLKTYDSNKLLKIIELLDKLDTPDTIDRDNMPLISLKQNLGIQKEINDEKGKLYVKNHSELCEKLSGGSLINLLEFEKKELEMKERMLKRVKQIPATPKYSEDFILDDKINKK